MLEKLLIAAAVIAVLFLIWLLIAGVRLFRTTRDWVRLFRSRAQSIELISIEPPKGFLIRREAAVTLRVVDASGGAKEVEHGIPVPIPQAFLWRVAGRVPTPIGRITDKRYFRRRLWGRRRKRREGQVAS